MFFRILQRGRSAGWRLAALLGLGIALLVTPALAPAAWAQSANVGEWEPTGFGGVAFDLVAPSSGALLARTADQIVRSDDGGVSWRPVLAATGSRGRVVVDPTNHDVFYEIDRSAVYRFTTETAGDPAARKALWYYGGNRTVLGLAISPADPNLLYLAYADGTRQYQHTFALLRSRDGGSTWETIQSRAHEPTCSFSTPLLWPHPTDARRLFMLTVCGSVLGYTPAALEHSPDQGEAWFTALPEEAASSLVEGSLEPRMLLGGEGMAPQRLYLLAQPMSSTSVGPALLRSDDGGSTWAQVVTFPGSGTNDRFGTPDVTFRGLIYDPAAPNRLFISRTEYAGEGAARRPVSGQVLTSADGGSTWTELGQRDFGRVWDLALGVDGASLYAATEQGVWRLRLR